MSPGPAPEVGDVDVDQQCTPTGTPTGSSSPDPVIGGRWPPTDAGQWSQPRTPTKDSIPPTAETPGQPCPAPTPAPTPAKLQQVSAHAQTPAPTLLSEEPERAERSTLYDLFGSAGVFQNRTSPTFTPRPLCSSSPELADEDFRHATPPKLLDEIAPGSGGVLVNATPLKATLPMSLLDTPGPAVPFPSPVKFGGFEPKCPDSNMAVQGSPVTKLQLDDYGSQADADSTPQAMPMPYGQLQPAPEPPPLVPMDGASPPSDGSPIPAYRPEMHTMPTPPHFNKQVSDMDTIASLLSMSNPEALSLASAQLQQEALQQQRQNQMLAQMLQQQQFNDSAMAVSSAAELQALSSMGGLNGVPNTQVFQTGPYADEGMDVQQAQQLPQHPSERFEEVSPTTGITRFSDPLMSDFESKRQLASIIPPPALLQTRPAVTRLNGMAQPPPPPPPPPSSGCSTLLHSEGVGEAVAACLRYGSGVSSQQPTTRRRIVVACPAPSQCCHQVLVAFKRRRQQYEAPYQIESGQYVLVTGDRGEDLGVVTSHWYGPRPQPSQTDDGYDSKNGQLAGRVLRPARQDEIQQLHKVQADMERRAVDSAMESVREHQLELELVDAEYQFDRKKLTFFYKAAARQDFRKLVRDLWRKHRARIWMEKVD
eukprot:TRINITY_DN625_c2_g1_i1.p1 TRINITY_DN625_c2_g1~~TRINITY_DN625_c2_g1_i1.p1  ORF type:complete len:650 (+),score=86.37 TRINITY_DN625_c2_g1_i1:125-2074(+)